ncbi:MAG: hypothetical protein MZV70_42760 [Desulfobacterales bacterium]|nr:hypothetical protein [Desulfobacterales bacterium]
MMAGTDKADRCRCDRRGRVRFRPGTGGPVQRCGGRLCGQDAGGSAGQTPRSGRSASAFMRAWRTRACRWWDCSPCRIPSRPSPRSSGQILVESEARRGRGRDRRTSPLLQPPAVRGGL